MNYRYKMVQIPRIIPAESSGKMGTAAASYLQKLADHYSAQGWEFYRLDSIGVYRPPGCIASFFGYSGDTVFYYVATFRGIRAQTLPEPSAR